MGFVNILPPIKLVSGDISTTADSWAAGQNPPNVPGAISFHKTSADKWSLLKYYQANASIVKGVGLVRPAAATAGYVLQTAGTADKYSTLLRGIAAANVSNTGYFSFCYIGGYCPDIFFNSAAASGQLFGLSGSNAGLFGSLSDTGTAIGSAGNFNSKQFFYPVQSFDTTGVNGGSTASGWISPILF